ncbi:tRNA (guanosine(46)-N7)-methyltransferase TrmB [Paenibacillus agilis]|uniref:tRNA (guanine-N(7)-)-methyltransferase n=1 Tax=Paenibacillus agilis TaxID=3020863 RepID=A0A559IWL5_9BACL|nr:tRNA (guanosine(46)-N7)-methyltransferase TrmB [Paenibacillus agilis]TVX92013.1 tRNA (guanosine(46)-N7)-methyltransferase TrmB [Paenibacillus agilis]
MRLRGKKGALSQLEQMTSLVVLEPEAHKGKWSSLFGNDNPIWVEFGMGKGQFITQMSLKYPHINFIGIDMYDELLSRASEKAMKAVEGLETDLPHPANLKLVRTNVETIENVFAENELERVYLNFSDPWPKKRHARRRLTHFRFVEKYIHIMNELGEIHFKTDSETLFESSLNSFADMELIMRRISLNLHRGGMNEEHVMTEYEQKFMGKGMNIHRVEVVVGEEAIRKYREEKQQEKRRAAVEEKDEQEEN